MKAIVSVIGKDKSGIISAITNELSNNHANIEDISQTILQDYFVMLMLIESKKVSIAVLDDKLKEVGKKIGVDIRVQHEDLFNAMHKI